MVNKWTLPQAIYMWIMGRDIVANEAKRDFMLTSAAIVSALAKDGSKISKRVLASLSGPQQTVEDLYEKMGDKQRMVLFGITDDDAPDDTISDGIPSDD